MHTGDRQIDTLNLDMMLVEEDARWTPIYPRNQMLVSVAKATFEKDLWYLFYIIYEDPGPKDGDLVKMEHNFYPIYNEADFRNSLIAATKVFEKYE